MVRAQVELGEATGVEQHRKASERKRKGSRKWKPPNSKFRGSPSSASGRRRKTPFKRGAGGRWAERGRGLRKKNDQQHGEAWKREEAKIERTKGKGVARRYEGGRRESEGGWVPLPPF